MAKTKTEEKNNGQQDTTLRTKDWATWTSLKTGVNTVAPQ